VGSPLEQGLQSAAASLQTERPLPQKSAVGVRSHALKTLPGAKPENDCEYPVTMVQA
jgi:hypothetical protein